QAGVVAGPVEDQDVGEAVVLEHVADLALHPGQVVGQVARLDAELDPRRQHAPEQPRPPRAPAGGTARRPGGHGRAALCGIALGGREGQVGLVGHPPHYAGCAGAAAVPGRASSRSSARLGYHWPSRRSITITPLTVRPASSYWTRTRARSPVCSTSSTRMLSSVASRSSP